MRIWKSDDGQLRINLDAVCHVFKRCYGEFFDLTAYTAEGGGPVEIDSDDAPSFLAALDAVSAPASDPAALDKVAATVESIRAMTMGDERSTYVDRLVAAALTDIVTLLRSRP